VQKLDFTLEWDRCQEALAAHEKWYRKVRISKDGAPEIGSDESIRIEPLIRVAINLYISCTSEQRESLREFFSSTDRCLVHLFKVVGRSIKEFEVLSSELNLEYALAAMSLENNHLDFRDSYVMLGHLYLTAVRKGIDTDPLIHRIASISDDWPVYAGQASMQNFLAEFKDSAFFKNLSLT
jgi:hypothetical protein